MADAALLGSAKKILEQPAQGAISVEQQALFIKPARHVIANTEGVGHCFADQAREWHYGVAGPRSIRGQATPREAVELMEGGIDIMAIPMPVAP